MHLLKAFVPMVVGAMAGAVPPRPFGANKSDGLQLMRPKASRSTCTVTATISDGSFPPPEEWGFAITRTTYAVTERTSTTIECNGCVIETTASGDRPVHSIPIPEGVDEPWTEWITDAGVTTKTEAVCTPTPVESEVLALQHQPDVTVLSRHVQDDQGGKEAEDLQSLEKRQTCILDLNRRCWKHDKQGYKGLWHALGDRWRDMAGSNEADTEMPDTFKTIIDDLVQAVEENDNDAIVQVPTWEDIFHVLDSMDLGLQGIEKADTQLDFSMRSAVALRDVIRQFFLLDHGQIERSQSTLAEEEIAATSTDAPTNISTSTSAPVATTIVSNSSCTTKIQTLPQFHVGPTSTTYLSTVTAITAVDCGNCTNVVGVPLPVGLGPAVFFTTTVEADATTTTEYACRTGSSSASN